LVNGDVGITLPPQAAPVKPSKRKPNLVCLKAKFKKDTGRILGAKQGKLLGVIPIENRLGETIYVDSMCASIRFTGNTTEDHYVKKAFWYGKNNYDIDIHAGDVEDLVMGQAIGDRWYYFDNPQRFIQEFGHQYSWDVDDSEPECITLSEGGILAEVSIFNLRYSENYLVAKFRISGDEQSGIEIVRV
jgi:hypothetical protein